MLHTIAKRTKRNFGIKMVNFNGKLTDDISAITLMLTQSCRQAFLLKIGEMLGMNVNKRMGTRYPTLLNDVRTINDYITILKEVHEIKFHETFMNSWKELLIWEAALALSCEYNFELSNIFKDKVVEYLIGELNYFSFSGRDKIFETRFFTPSFLHVLTENLITIYKTSNKVNKLDKGIISKLEGLSRNFKEMIKMIK